jgi:hypothetical protein
MTGRLESRSTLHDLNITANTYGNQHGQADGEA